MTHTMKIYRIENPDTMSGMWYDRDGNYDPFIMTLTEGISKDLPMGEDKAKYGQQGRHWYSGCQSKELLAHWFSEKDIEELIAAGYKLYEFECTEYIQEDVQVIFTREGVISQTEVVL